MQTFATASRDRAARSAAASGAGTGPAPLSAEVHHILHPPRVQRMCNECEEEIYRKADRSTVARQSAVVAEPPCAAYAAGEVATSHTEAGHLSPDVSLNAPGEILIADFGVDWRHVKTSAQSEPLLTSWISRWDADTSYHLEVAGYSDCAGVEPANTTLREGRAQRVAALLPAALRTRVTSQTGAPPGDYIDSNATIVGRARNRSVAVRFHQEVTLPELVVTAGNCTSPPNPAADLSDYVFLVQCAERATGYTPRRMLSLLRQIYYGTETWSGTRSRYWAQVIPCGLPFTDPRPLLGLPLYNALRASKVVDGVDVGHVFTGLESMVCPTATVELEVPYAPNPIVDMPNEEFATWGGDLGQAAAFKTHDEVDLSIIRPWTRYFETAGTAASSEDLLGDIDAYVLRTAIGSSACAGSAATTLPSPTSPISDILSTYYAGTGPAGATTSADRYRCFVRAIGGTISGTRITNKAALQTPIRDRVRSFAETYYLGLVTIPLIGVVGAMSLLRSSIQVTELFLDWLENHL